MSELNDDIEHNFDLRGMKIGDWFLGCNPCQYQLPVKAGGSVACPECGERMNMYDVTAEDIVPDC